jgi:glutathione S-transferase
MTITLYEVPVSANARKVRLIAAELGLPLHRVTLDFRRGDFRAPEFLAKNPNGKIPVIEEDGFVLWESTAILRYLAAKKPERGLLPDEPREAARLDQWLFWWVAHPEPALDHLAVERRLKPYLGQPGHDPSILADAGAALGRFLPVLDGQLAGNAYILGKLSLVDFVAAPRLEMAPLIALDLAPYANIRAWLERLQAKAYWKDA